MSQAKIRSIAVGVAAALCTGSALVGSAAVATADPGPSPVDTDVQLEAQSLDESRPDPLAAKEGARRSRAIQNDIARRADVTDSTRAGRLDVPERSRRAASTSTDQPYVALPRTRTDRVFVLLVQFGDQRLDRYPDVDTDPDIAGPTRFDGPAHDTIPAPDRRLDNSTIWRPQFDRAYFEKLYFGSGSQSMKSYWERQSSGRYSIEGQVSDWVTVPYNQARYGRSNGFPCAEDVCGNSWFLVQDALQAWYDQQLRLGQTPAQIKATLASFDVWNATQNKAGQDGYLDRLQIVHAGGDQAVGDPQYGEDAIWSHRWRAFPNLPGSDPTGPAGNQLGGTQVADTGIWGGQYTLQAENAGLSVFAHEYGHELGLPDLYDTDEAGDNPVNWWSLMGQSRLKAARDVGVGSRPGDLGAWEKLQLGWLTYTVATVGQEGTVELGPHEYHSDKLQALAVVLPQRQVSAALPPPEVGEEPGAVTVRRLVLPGPAAASLKLTASGVESVEIAVGTGDDLDFTAVPAAGGGGSGPATFVLTPWAGRQVTLRLRWTAGAPPATESARLVAAYNRYYLASYRTGLSYDQFLSTGPYHFGWEPGRPKLAEFFGYGRGLLVNYWDTSYGDNNTSDHPGAGLVLPIDAKPAILKTTAGAPWRGRIQTYDAPFSLRPSTTMVLHDRGRANLILGTRGQPLFDDTRSYWSDVLPQVGVKTAAAGVTLRVTEQNPSTMKVEVGISPAAPTAKQAAKQAAKQTAAR